MLVIIAIGGVILIVVVVILAVSFLSSKPVAPPLPPSKKVIPPPPPVPLIPEISPNIPTTMPVFMPPITAHFIPKACKVHSASTDESISQKTVANEKPFDIESPAESGDSSADEDSDDEVNYTSAAFTENSKKKFVPRKHSRHKRDLDIIDVTEYGDCVLALLKDGDIIKEEVSVGKRRRIKNNVILTSIDGLGDEVYGVDVEGKFYQLRLDTFDSRTFHWKEIILGDLVERKGERGERITHMCKTLNDEYLILQTSKMGFIYSHENLKGKDPVAKSTYKADGIIRIYGESLNDYILFSPTDCVGVVMPEEKRLNNICYAALNTNKNIEIITKKEVASYTKVKIINYKAYYLFRV